VQAAAALHGAWPEWDLGAGDTIDPDDRVDAGAIRDRYHAAAH
jgi:hypothetical protein